MAFCPCPKHLPETKVKSSGIILLLEEISKQLRIDFVMWFLVVTLVNIYNEKEQAEQRYYKMKFLRRKRALGIII